MLGAACLTAIAAAPRPRACAPLRVMTYNIRLDVESDGANRWAARRDQLIGQIAFVQPDILGLQEVVPGQKADLERALPDYRFVGVARDDGKAAGEYSSLAVRNAAYDIRSSGTFWLSPTPDKPSKGWDSAYPRIATWAHLVRRADGRRILALNTHLDHVGEVARREGARRISAFLSQHRLPGERIVVTGDFNAEPGSPPLRMLTSAPLSLRDSKAAARTPAIGPEGTFNGFEAVPKEGRRIDYVLAEPSIRVKRHATLAWHFKDGRVASDHFPVVADFEDCR